MDSADWDALIPELRQWNNGKGIDPESWVGCEGNFRLASAYSLIFWPKFTELDGLVFRGEMDRETLAQWMQNCAGARRCGEATANHIHIVDLHHVGCADASVERVVFLGTLLAEIYRTKLAADFPGRDIGVEFYPPESQKIQEYQLTFYQQHDS